MSSLEVVPQAPAQSPAPAFRRAFRLPAVLLRWWSRQLHQFWLKLALHPRKASLCGTILALFMLRLVRRLHTAMRESLALMNPCDEKLDTEIKAKIEHFCDTGWGRGLPWPPPPGQWRPFLNSDMSATENMIDLHGILGLISRSWEEMTLEQIAEGVRRLMTSKYPELPLATKHYWSQSDATSIARALATECGITELPERGGLEECCVLKMSGHAPWPLPKWMQLTSRWGIGAQRLVFLHQFGWASRFVETPLGRMHVYDTGPAVTETEPLPPLLLQHGMFCTGWSVAPLAWMLSRLGRRVLVPDLFDFDHGLSASSSGQVRSTPEFVSALVCIMRELRREGAHEVDLAGHSFGAFLVTKLLRACEDEGIKVRRLVMLGPGGPLCIRHRPLPTRFIHEPFATMETFAPKWIPSTISKAVAGVILGIALSANNLNTLLSQPYANYLCDQAFGVGRMHPTLLLWGDADDVCIPRTFENLAPYVAERFPKLDAFFVRGGGHNIQLGAVFAVSYAMDAWLRAPEAEVGRAAWSPPKSEWPWQRPNLYKMEFGVEALSASAHSLGVPRARI